MPLIFELRDYFTVLYIWGTFNSASPIAIVLWTLEPGLCHFIALKLETIVFLFTCVFMCGLLYVCLFIQYDFFQVFFFQKAVTVHCKDM